MDSYVDKFQAAGGSMVMLAKGNRSKQVSSAAIPRLQIYMPCRNLSYMDYVPSMQVTNACGKYGGFYLGSIGGPAAILAKNCIKKVEVLEYPELGELLYQQYFCIQIRIIKLISLLGMEAIWRVEVEDFPAFIVVDDKGNDFFKEWQTD